MSEKLLCPECSAARELGANFCWALSFVFVAEAKIPEQLQEIRDAQLFPDCPSREEILNVNEAVVS